MSVVIEVENYSFCIGRASILHDVSLTVRDGDYIAVIGPNGAGKTTLLKCLNRILTGGDGVIRVLGRELSAYSQTELAAVVAYVPQADGRRLPFRVYDFVMMGRYPHLSPFSSVSHEDDEAVRAALALTGTEVFADRRMTTLSGGERQKVFIAAALAQSASVLLLDEPTTFLDPHHQADIFRVIRRINRETQTTILAVTHDVNGAALSSTRVVAIKDGTIAYDGSPDGMMTNEVLRGLYDKDFLFVRHPRTGTPLMVPEGGE